MARGLNAKEFLAKKFKLLAFEGQWAKAFGLPEENFSMIIYGKSGNGKTELAVAVCKYMTRFGKVAYNSYEQGHSASLQQSFMRQAMHEVGAQVLVLHKEPFAELIKRLRRKKSPPTVVLDSVQYMGLTYEQWQELRRSFPRKRFILIAHAEGDAPKGSAAKSIEFDVDIKVLVKGFKIFPASRFGGNQSFISYEKGHQEWLTRQARYKAPLVAQEAQQQPSADATSEDLKEQLKAV